MSKESLWGLIGTVAFGFTAMPIMQTCVHAPRAGIVSGAPEDYNQAGSMICTVHTGRLEEAKTVCKDLGLTVVRTMRSRHILACRWEPPSKIDEKTLKKLIGSGEFRHIEPGIAARKLAPMPSADSVKNK